MHVSNGGSMTYEFHVDYDRHAWLSAPVTRTPDQMDPKEGD